MITRYVNTAAAPGGDGTTNGLVGPNAAWLSLATAAGVLAAAPVNDDLTVECCGQAADTLLANVSVSNWTVAPGQTITVRGNPGDPNGAHPGYWSNTHYRIVGNFPGSNILDVGSQRDTLIDKLQVEQQALWCAVGLGGNLNDGSRFERCLLNTCAKGIDVNMGAGRTVYIKNCAIVGAGGDNGIQCNSNAVDVINTVVLGFLRGLYQNGGWVIAQNCSVWNNGDDFVGVAGGIDRCASDDGDGTNPVAVPSWPAQFYNPLYATALDFRIVGTSVLRGAGLGPALDPTVPPDDIAGNARAGDTCTVGPWEDWTFVPLVPRTWAQPYNGIITAVHLPAVLWKPNESEDMNPNPAIAFSNSFGAPNYDRVDGWTFSHPSTLNPYRGSHVDTEIVLPDWVRQRHVADGEGAIAEIGFEFSYFTTGDAQADSIFHFVEAKVCPEAGGPFSAVAWTLHDASDASGPAAFTYRVKGAYRIPLGAAILAWGPNTVLRLRVGRYYVAGLPPVQETWTFETVFTGATIYYKTA